MDHGNLVDVRALDAAPLLSRVEAADRAEILQTHSSVGFRATKIRALIEEKDAERSALQEQLNDLNREKVQVEDRRDVDPTPRPMIPGWIAFICGFLVIGSENLALTSRMDAAELDDRILATLALSLGVGMVAKWLGHSLAFINDPESEA